MASACGDRKSGAALPLYLEFCYLLVYGIGAYSLGVIVAANINDTNWRYTNLADQAINRFWTVYLTGTLLAYALFPYFPSQPPRYVFPGLRAPHDSDLAADVESMGAEWRNDSFRCVSKRARFIGVLGGVGFVFGFTAESLVRLEHADLRGERVGGDHLRPLPLRGRCGSGSWSELNSSGSVPAFEGE